MLKFLSLVSFFLLGFSVPAQLLEDDFDGNSTISSWYADDALMDTAFSNPFVDAANPSATVLRYEDIGGVFANIGFDANERIRIADDTPFSLKIYVPSDGLTGNQPNQISLKLQDGNLAQPWTTQTEIIKAIELDEWQEVTFDFAQGPYVNLDPSSSAPRERTDLNRVLLQVNGENNSDQVVAYIDDFYFEGGPSNEGNDPIYDELVWQDEFEQEGAAGRCEMAPPNGAPAGR